VLFNRQQFETALQDVTEQLPVRNDFPGLEPPQERFVHVFDTLPSTNQTLWELLNQGATSGTVVIAAQQTAGRGQWGRQWQSTLGGLYLSLALTPNLDALDSAQLILCSAWGIAIALRTYNIPVFLKWPNDLLLLGRKLGGILAETRVHQGQITKAVVGVGINWSNGVPESGINLQSFYEEQLNPAVISLEMLAAIVIQGLNLGYQRWSEKGITALLPSYLKLLDSLGRHVIVDGTPGIVTGVTPTGELRVRLGSTDAETRSPLAVRCARSLPSTTAVGQSCTSADVPEIVTASSYSATSPTTTPTEICLKPGTISLGYNS
jgi:BirA family transcriptional regulator, biotin operon repressor / biotin---[acetyl-CoA-carboxylase] ligase